MLVLQLIISAIHRGVAILRHAGGQTDAPALDAPATAEEIERVNVAAATTCPEAKNWPTSIVDLMKIHGLDSSLANRKDLAAHLGYTGKLDGSAEMNEWLHAAVMRKVAEDYRRPANA